jgi:glycosyltransferase involved in cell wall biosynthesis
MMRLFLNGAAASAGGGLTYLRNVIPQLSRQKDVVATVAVDAEYREQLPQPDNVSFVEASGRLGAGMRFLWEQSSLRAQIKAARADVLLSAGNFALWRSPVPQVLLSGNCLYLSRDFSADLRERHEYGMLTGHYIRGSFAKRSIRWADCTVAPSFSFADDLRRWTGAKSIQTIHHGFDHEAFFQNQTPLPGQIQTKLDSCGNAIRLLFVSPYNYYRNFETLFRALPLIRNLTGRDTKLFLTCRLQPGENPGSYNVDRALSLVRELGIGGDIIQLGPIPNHLLHHVYRSCHLYVTASYAETFAHPVVEAMACGLPIVASDIAVHREICGQAGVYFECFAPEKLAQRVATVIGGAGQLEQMSKAAKMRSLDFSWQRHTEVLLTVLSSPH